MEEKLRDFLYDISFWKSLKLVFVILRKIEKIYAVINCNRDSSEAVNRFIEEEKN